MENQANVEWMARKPPSKFISRALARRFAIAFGDLPYENLRFSSAHFAFVPPRARAR